MVQTRGPRLGRLRSASLAGLVALMTVGGSMHFFATESYVSAVPSFLPWRREIVYASGVIEMLCGVSLIPERARQRAAWLTMIVLVLIFPANIQMALEGPKPGGSFPFNSAAALWLRLPLQLVFIAWAYSFTKSRDSQENRLSAAVPAE